MRALSLLNHNSKYCDIKKVKLSSSAKKVDPTKAQYSSILLNEYDNFLELAFSFYPNPITQKPGMFLISAVFNPGDEQRTVENKEKEYSRIQMSYQSWRDMELIDFLVA